MKQKRLGSTRNKTRGSSAGYGRQAEPPPPPAPEGALSRASADHFAVPQAKPCPLFGAGREAAEGARPSRRR